MYVAPDLVAPAADVAGDVVAAAAASVAFPAIVVASVDVDVDVVITQYISCKFTFTRIRSLLP